jgi:hypothetical protein
LVPKGKRTTSRKKRDTERSLPFSDDKISREKDETDATMEENSKERSLSHNEAESPPTSKINMETRTATKELTRKDVTRGAPTSIPTEGPSTKTQQETQIVEDPEKSNEENTQSSEAEKQEGENLSENQWKRIPTKTPPLET